MNCLNSFLGRGLPRSYSLLKLAAVVTGRKPDQLLRDKPAGRCHFIHLCGHGLVEAYHVVIFLPENLNAAEFTYLFTY